MTINRRTFNLSTLGLATTSLLPSLAQAQAAAVPVEGRDFVKLSAPVAVPPGNKIDVVEFFWYGCPACYSFEPALEAWIKKVPNDVAFRRVHVAFSSMHETHAKMFYALEQIGALEVAHKKVFAAMHVQRMRLDKESDIAAFVKSVGVDEAKFVDAFRSFGVSTKVRQSKQAVEAYKIDGVPSVGVHGRWYTAPSLNGGDHAKALAVTDHLIQRARKA